MLYHIDDLIVDPQAQTVRRDGEKINLTGLSFKVFAELLSAAPQPLNSAQLAERAWQSIHVSDETIAQRITLLRRTLGDDTQSPRYIRTVRGAGYVAASPVTQHEPRTPSSVGSRWRIAAVGLFSLFIAVYFLTKTDWSSAPAVEDTSAPSAVNQLVQRAQEQLQVQQAKANDRAIKMLREALLMDSANTAAQTSLSFALSARATKFDSDANDATQAEELAKNVLKQEPSNSQAWHALGYSLDARGRVDEALAAYRQAYELNPADTAAISSAAYLLSVRGRLFDSLLLDAQGMRSDKPSRYAEIQIARVLDLIDHPAELGWRQRAQLLNPDQVVIVAENAEAKLRLGNHVEALNLLGQAEQLVQSSPRLLRLKGRGLLIASEHELAEAAFNLAGDAAEFELAALKVQQGDPSRVESLILKIQTQLLNGNSWPGTRFQLAELYGAMQQIDKAISMLSQAVDLGWRDTGEIESSPFLKSVVKSPSYTAIQHRIARELKTQRGLVESNARLQEFLNTVVKRPSTTKS